MQRKIQARPLRENFYGTLFPAPTVRVIDITTLNGGLNLWELDYRMDANQSPDLVNVFWRDGSLSSRPGQEYIYDDYSDEQHNYGDFYACYERLWQGYVIAHKGTSLYKIDPETGAHTIILNGGLTEIAGGHFFSFGTDLYYMSGREYIRVTTECTAAPVEPYVPIVVVNRLPNGTGGDIFQDENRLSPKKRIQFTSDGTSTDYKVPAGYTPMDDAAVKAEMLSPTPKMYYEVQTFASRSAFPTVGKSDIYYYSTADTKYYKWANLTYTTVTAPTIADTFTVDRESGIITFNTAPEAAMTQSPSNIEITISKGDTATQNSILRCRCVAVYGGDTQLSVVCGGTPGQPNAYFWSGSTTLGVDPTYFPFDYYNYAGANAQEYITGFGKQQSMLVIFKERSIGKSYFTSKTINDTEYLALPYTPVNDNIGCDLGDSIKLIDNNLVFANTYGGVYVMLDSTAYGENNLKRISRNVNGEGTVKGLLYDVRQPEATGVVAYDDQQRYWLCANGKVYLWDYSISSYGSREENISWFYFDNVNAAGWCHDIEDTFYFLPNGSLAKFCDEYNDFGSPILRRYTFATQNFNTYEVLKDVVKVVFAVRSDTDSAMNITYKTDHEIRTDLTPIRAYSYRLSPRDLSHRGLKPIPYAATAVRTPRCFHIRHFAMMLENNEINTDMSIVNAQIFYRYVREDR